MAEAAYNLYWLCITITDINRMFDATLLTSTHIHPMHSRLDSYICIMSNFDSNMSLLLGYRSIYIPTQIVVSLDEKAKMSLKIHLLLKYILHKTQLWVNGI